MKQENKPNEASEFKKRAETLSLWKSKADDLAKGAKVLWGTDVTELENNIQYHEHHRAAVFLMAVSLECLIKAVLINSDSDVFDNEEQKKHKTHRLNGLFDKAKVCRTEEEKKFLEKCTTRLLWAGKYPVPKHHEDLKKKQFERVAILSSNDYDTFETIFNKLKEKFRSNQDNNQV